MTKRDLGVEIIYQLVPMQKNILFNYIILREYPSLSPSNVIGSTFHNFCPTCTEVNDIADIEDFIIFIKLVNILAKIVQYLEYIELPNALSSPKLN